MLTVSASGRWRTRDVPGFWDLFPAIFLLSWAVYNWLAYKYPRQLPNPFGVGEWHEVEREEAPMTYTLDHIPEEKEPNRSAQAQLGMDRSEGSEDWETYDIKHVPLSVHERDAIRNAIEEYLDKAGQIRGMPEAEGWVRAAWWVLVDLDESKTPDELDPPDPIDHQAWREAEAERTGVDPVTGTDVE